jgi:hypothetical protein
LNITSGDAPRVTGHEHCHTPKRILLAPELEADAIRAATGAFANHERLCQSVVADIVNGAPSIRSGNAIGAQEVTVSADQLLTTRPFTAHCSRPVSRAVEFPPAVP